MSERVPVEYSSPPARRRLARGLGIAGAILLALAVWMVVRGWQRRAAAGLPADYTGIVMWFGPTGLLLIGLWIGWGHTRVDLKRRRVVRRPLGLPWPNRSRKFSEARKLHVGFHRGPTSMGASHYASQASAPIYWYVMIQGSDFHIPLIVQRATRQEALDFANALAQETGLPVSASKPPGDS